MLMKWEEIKVQFNKEQQKFIENTIFIAQQKKISQEVTLKIGNMAILKLGIFPSGLIYKFDEDKN